MKEKLQLITNRFMPFKQKDCDKWRLQDIKMHPELMAILYDLYALLQDKTSFEVVFQEGFRQTGHQEMESRSGHKWMIESWNLASPLLPLLQIMDALLDAESLGFRYGNRRASNFAVGKKHWGGGLFFGFDLIVCEKLKQMLKEETFLGFFDLDLSDPTQEKAYKDHIFQLSRSPIKTTVLFRLCDGIYSESLCLIKELSGKLTALIATDKTLTPSHIHKATKHFATKYMITLIPCQGMEIIHDGDCCLYSENNINLLLYEALKIQSVYQTLISLKNNKLDLRKGHIPPSLLGIQSSHPCDSLLLKRWLTGKGGNFFLRVNRDGWFDFCKLKSFNPLYIVKTDFYNWPLDEYMGHLRFPQNKPSATFPLSLPAIPDTDNQQAIPITSTKSFCPKETHLTSNPIGVKIPVNISTIEIPGFFKAPPPISYSKLASYAGFSIAAAAAVSVLALILISWGITSGAILIPLLFLALLGLIIGVAGLETNNSTQAVNIKI